ncbi:MAG: glycoside hydrolase family 140 protein [Cyclobacteriaceae bacterium]
MHCKIQLIVLLCCFARLGCTQPWETHGALQVSDNGHFLEHEDSSGFFWLGCTAWMLPRLAPADVDRYLQDRKEKQFTVIQFTTNNMGRPNYAGELPFLDGERPWDKVKPNEPYWQHIDYIVNQAKEQGLYLAMFVWWGSDANDPGWQEKKSTRQHFTNPDQHNYEFGRMLGERYQNQPHIIWVGAGEYHKPVSVMFPNNQRPLTDSHRNRLVEVIDGIRDTNKSNHLYTIHPISFVSSSEEFHDEPWMDFNMIQSHAVPSFIIPLTLADWNRTPTKPTFNAEGWYENEHALYKRWTGMDKTNGLGVDPGWKQRYQAYWSVFAGGIGFTYGHKNLWRMEDFNENPGVLLTEVLNAPGSAHLMHLRTLVESKPIQTRIPDPLLVSAGTTGRDNGLSPDLRIATRSEPGDWSFVYSTRGSLIRVVMSRLAEGQADAYWYSPRSGQWNYEGRESNNKVPFQMNIPSGTNSPDVYFDPPGKSEDGNDWVLVLEVK